MFNISISLSNGDISLLIIAGISLFFISNHIYSYIKNIKKIYMKSTYAIISIGENLHQINNFLNNEFISNHNNILEIKNNSKKIDKKLNIMSAMFVIKDYFDFIIPIINTPEFSKICYNFFVNTFDTIENIINKKYPKENFTESNVAEKNNWTEINEKLMQDILNQTININNNINKNFDKNNIINDFESKNDDIISKVKNDKEYNNMDENKIIKNSIINSLDAHPKLYLSNGLANNEKNNKDMQEKFDEYIYNTDKLKKTIGDFKLKKDDSKIDNVQNKLNKFVEGSLMDGHTDKSNIEGLNDGNMAYAPFN